MPRDSDLDMSVPQCELCRTHREEAEQGHGGHVQLCLCPLGHQQDNEVNSKNDDMLYITRKPRIIKS